MRTGRFCADVGEFGSECGSASADYVRYDVRYEAFTRKGQASANPHTRHSDAGTQSKQWLGSSIRTPSDAPYCRRCQVGWRRVGRQDVSWQQVCWLGRFAAAFDEAIWPWLLIAT